MKQLLIAVAVSVVGLIAAVSADDDLTVVNSPAKDVPEMQVLAAYFGTWDTSLTNSDARGIAKGEWVNGGRFLRQTWSLDAGAAVEKLTGTTMFTWDARLKTYRSWTYISTGLTLEARCTWDAAKKTMTSTARNEGENTTITTTASFAEEGAENWTMTTRDSTGAVLSELRGRNVRRNRN